MATYAQRLTSVIAIQQGGKGLLAVADPVDDVIAIKDPAPHTVPTGGAKTPVAGQAATVTWRLWPGVDGQTAYGL